MARGTVPGAIAEEFRLRFAEPDLKLSSVCVTARDTDS